MNRYISYFEKEKDSNKVEKDEEKKNSDTESRFAKAIKNFNENEDDVSKEFLCHINWLWALPASELSVENKYGCPEEFNIKILNKNFTTENKIGIGNIGTAKTSKVDAFLFLIKFVNSIWNPNGQDLTDIQDLTDQETRGKITNIIKELKGNPTMKNALLHLCDPQNYEPILTEPDKQKIDNAFYWMLEGNVSEDIDVRLKAIRKELSDAYGREKGNPSIEGDYSQYKGGFSFYEEGIRELWQINDTKVDKLDDVQLLEYKKAMVLYGPPGTSKTYSAMQLARLLVTRGMIKHLNSDRIDESTKESIKNELGYILGKKKVSQNEEEKRKEKKILEKYIDRLQMHINYNYEDFVAGQVIKDNTVVTQPGYIFKAIEKANKNPEIPYVVILDEINRTDISRVFGEVFSAMEYRKDDIILPFKITKNSSLETQKEKIAQKKNNQVKNTKPTNENKAEESTKEIETNLVLNIPDNLYFIGTMNEIDFSLERIDFALRRRFVWVEKTYDSKRLNAILNEKESTILQFEDIKKYCNKCDALNGIIKITSELGDKYLIGHAFFAEISNILDKFEDDNKKWEKAKKVLWQISIKPIIEAYCGSMDTSRRDEILNECKNKFLLPNEKSDKQ